jgi:sn-glycerol 3-phosphate transport system ATP-binding protein
VSLAGRLLDDVPPQHRNIAMVFQGYALYPQMTVRENMAFPLVMRNTPPSERRKLVDEAAAMLRLEQLLDRRPSELSGGERQRVAMGRAIVRKPRVFLFDEPLSNLDAALRGDLRLEIGQLVRRLGATAMYVTHDHVEAMTLADRIAVMSAGRLQQLDTPRTIYDAPANAFVARFLGSPRINLLDGVVEGERIVCGALSVRRPQRDMPSRVQVGIRPEHVRLVEDGVPAETIAVEPLGAETHLFVRAGGADLRLRVGGFAVARAGDTVRVALDDDRVLLFDPAREGARV